MAITPAQVVDLLIALDPLTYNTVAAFMFLLWDHCISFSEEVELVWRSKWSLVKVLFLIIRYLAFIVQLVNLVIDAMPQLVHPSVSSCMGWIKWQLVSGQILIICVDVLLVLRVYAFYGRSKVLLTVLIVLFLCEAISMAIIGGISIPGADMLDLVANPLPSNLHVPACVALTLPPLFSKYWISGLIFGSILFFLVTVKFVQTRWNAGVDSPHVLIVFVRDGTWAFAVLFGINLWMCLSFKSSAQQGDISLTWSYSVLGFCGSRLVLNLRSAAVENMHSDWGTVEMHTIKVHLPGKSGTETMQNQS